MVENKRKHGQAGIDCRVTQNQHTIVDRDGDEVENAGEDGLDHGDDKTTMDDELGKDSRALIA